MRPVEAECWYAASDLTGFARFRVSGCHHHRTIISWCHKTEKCCRDWPLNERTCYGFRRRVKRAQTSKHAPSSRSSCPACSSADPTDATLLSSRAAWRCLVCGRSTWCTADSSLYSAASSAGTPTGTWHQACCDVSDWDALLCHCNSQSCRCRLQHFITHWWRYRQRSW